MTGSVAFTLAAMTFSGPAAGQDWVSLGGTLNSEIDMQSLHMRDNLPVAQMRYGGQTAQGSVGMTLEMAAICAEDYLYILGGTSTASWSARVLQMPDLPEEDRIIYVPAPNEAFNNFFTYLCRK
ncbi:hypothetical protein [Gemmobacter serpentinus]|uniref:hypothetical protein n=1 Tax=Gemmobacter serpentinus TaxID=2652247 RepID=UPI0018658153|nr:hypothetical protein [Gemmobacter serpentinus]